MSTATLSRPRSGINAPLSIPRFISPSIELFSRVIVETGGGQYAGVWTAIPGRSEPLVLFNSLATGATLGCLLSELSAELVRKKILDSDSYFAATQEKP